MCPIPEPCYMHMHMYMYIQCTEILRVGVWELACMYSCMTSCLYGATVNTDSQWHNRIMAKCEVNLHVHVLVHSIHGFVCIVCLGCLSFLPTFT